MGEAAIATANDICKATNPNYRYVDSKPRHRASLANGMRLILTSNSPRLIGGELSITASLGAAF